MFEQLMDLIKGNSKNAVINNPDVPDQHNEGVMQQAGSSIISSLQSMLANGQGKDVLSLFNGQQHNLDTHPAMQHISGNFISNIMSKFGLNSQQAGNVSASLLPQVLDKFINKTNDPSDNSFNIQDIFNKLSNNNTSGLNIPGMLSKFKGSSMLDKDGDGDVDFHDLTAAFSGHHASGGGGILDKLKGMMGG